MESEKENMGLGQFFLWLFLYSLGQNLGYVLSGLLGLPWLGTAVINLGLSLILLGILRRRGALSCLGLRPVRGELKDYLWFLPLVILSTSNLWGGISRELHFFQVLLQMLALGLAAFLEEMIFRGFFFRFLSRKSGTAAVWGSAAVFALVHVLNLSSALGMNLTENLWQVALALLLGLLYGVLLLQSGSLLPGILSHGAINVLSVVSPNERLPLAPAVTALLTLAYLGYLIVNNKGERYYE